MHHALTATSLELTLVRSALVRAGTVQTKLLVYHVTKDIGMEHSVQLHVPPENMEIMTLILALIALLPVQHVEIHPQHAFHVKEIPYFSTNMIVLLSVQIVIILRWT